jgi:hypothetical protein
MAGAPDTGLEGRLAAVEAALRSLMATNWTDRASVVDASGGTVPLSALAFGQVIAENPTVGAVSLTSTPNVASSTSNVQEGWTYPAPTVDVYVSGSRMRVDWAAVLATNANVAAQPELCMSYRVLYRGLTNDGSVNTLVVMPSRYRCIKLQNYGGDPKVEAYGAFGFHSGLTPGWYRVQPAFYLAYAATGSAVTVSADYPRIGVTPL